MSSNILFPVEKRSRASAAKATKIFVSDAESMTPVQFLESSLRVLEGRGDAMNPRLAQVLREIRSLLVEFSDPRPSDRPIFPRFLRVAAMMIEHDLV